MDPNATLKEIRALLDNNDTQAPDRLDDLERLFDLVEALDGWIARGGYLPDAWKVDR